jgi:hypothetical protein
MDFAKETRKIPSLVNPQNFKPIKPKVIDPQIIKQSNSKKLNIFLAIFFVLFLFFFFWNCKYGFLKGEEKNPEPFSIVYNLNSV